MAELNEERGKKGRGEPKPPDLELDLDAVSPPEIRPTPEEGESRKTDELSVEKEENHSGRNGQFLDFDVWLATLEANFGPDFERVLTDGFGVDWNSMINSRITAGEDFFEVVQDLKHILKNVGRTEPEDEDFESGGISFEALGQGEIMGGYGPGGSGSGGGPGGGGEGEKRGQTPLGNFLHKEFTAGDKLKIEAAPENFAVEKVFLYQDKDRDKADKDSLPEDELVMMERRDFSRLSYFASKEIRRHQDDAPNPSGATGSTPAGKQAQHGKAAGITILVGVLVAACAFFSLGSFIYFSSFPDHLVAEYPPDFVLRLSSSLYKQGGLMLAGKDGTENTPLLVYTFQPSIRRLEMKYARVQGEHIYVLGATSGNLLAITTGPNGDSVTVRQNYNENMPFSPTEMQGEPLLSLEENGKPVMAAYETTASAILPGLTHLVLRDPDGQRLGDAYNVHEFIYISWNDKPALQTAALDTLATRLVLLFSLLGH